MACRASEYPGKEVYLERLGVEENFVWCLVIVVIFMGLGEAKWWMGGLKLCGDNPQRASFLWRLTPLDTMNIVR